MSPLESARLSLFPSRIADSRCIVFMETPGFVGGGSSSMPMDATFTPIGEGVPAASFTPALQHVQCGSHRGTRGFSGNRRWGDPPWDAAGTHRHPQKFRWDPPSSPVCRRWGEHHATRNERACVILLSNLSRLTNISRARRKAARGHHGEAASDAFTEGLPEEWEECKTRDQLELERRP